MTTFQRIQKLTKMLFGYGNRLTVAEANIDVLFERFTEQDEIKKYVALLTQTGTNAPTAIVLENSLDEEPTFSYAGVGDYSIDTVEDIFTAEKTFLNIPNNDSTSQNSIAWSAADAIQLKSFVANGTETNGLLSVTPIMIIVYP